MEEIPEDRIAQVTRTLDQTKGGDMYSHARVLLTIILLGLLCACQQPTENQADKEAIQALISKVEAANNAGDVDTWVSCFAPTFAYMPPNLPPVTDRDSLIELARAGFRNHASIRISPLEIHVYNDWAFARSHVGGSVELFDSGKILELDLKQLAVYRRDSQGTWQITHLMINSNS